MGSDTMNLIDWYAKHIFFKMHTTISGTDRKTFQFNQEPGGQDALIHLIRWCRHHLALQSSPSRLVGHVPSQGSHPIFKNPLARHGPEILQRKSRARCAGVGCKSESKSKIPRIYGELSQLLLYHLQPSVGELLQLKWDKYERRQEAKAQD